MKKYICLLLAASALLASCEKDPVGETATVKLAGTWYTTIEYLDQDTKEWVPASDPFAVEINTYNTAANKPTEMFVDVNGENIYEIGYYIQAKVSCDVKGLTFGDGAKELVNNYAADNHDEANDITFAEKVKIYDGKVTKGAATTPSGKPADAIELSFEVTPDILPLLIEADWTEPVKYRVTGYRKTGLVDDEP